MMIEYRVKVESYSNENYYKYLLCSTYIVVEVLTVLFPTILLSGSVTVTLIRPYIMVMLMLKSTIELKLYLLFLLEPDTTIFYLIMPFTLKGTGASMPDIANCPLAPLTLVTAIR
jgi:hypothetical protein